MAAATVEIEGMTCGHCVMSVTEELSAIGATEVAIELNKGGVSKAVISSAGGLTDAQITDAVAEAGYTVTGIAR